MFLDFVKCTCLKIKIKGLSICHIRLHNVQSEKNMVVITSKLIFYEMDVSVGWATVVVPLVKVFSSHTEGQLFESQLHQTQIFKTHSDSSTAKRSAIVVSGMCPRRRP